MEIGYQPSIGEFFDAGDFRYCITSDTTVTVTECLNTYDYDHVDNYCEDFSGFEIPNHIKYIHDYTVTAIGDSAFYDINYYCVTIPESISTIGHKAFGGETYSNFIICQAEIPPLLHGSFDSQVDIFVQESDYALYNEEYGQDPLISLHMTNGERTEFSYYSEELNYPDDLYQSYLDLTGNELYPYYSWSYGCILKFVSNNNTQVTLRFCEWSPEGRLDVYWWDDYDYDSFVYENTYWIPHGFELHVFAIEEGKSPSYLSHYDNYTGENLFSKKFEMSFDFKESGIAYNIMNQYLQVCDCWYSQDYGEDYYFIPILYSGDVVIPEKATYHDYLKDTYTSYPVTSIGNGAFSLRNIHDQLWLYEDLSNDSLTSVTIPTSITTIDDFAFGDCPNLRFIKCLGATPPSASDNSFDDGVYQNTTLYVPISALEAYKNAEGWKNFQQIIGFADYDFVVDGIYYKKTENNEVIVTRGEDAYHGVVNIPATVTHDGMTYNVTGIETGTFSNMTIESMILPVSIHTINDNAFDGCHIGTLIINGDGTWTAGAINADIDALYVMSTVTGIPGLTANPEVIYSYSTVPPTCDEQSFAGYDADLHVPASSLAAYFTAPYWCNFINIAGDAIEPTGLTINKDSVGVIVGNEVILSAVPAPANATPREIVWTSSNDSIATVTNGVITAIKVGECDIKAYLLDKIATCHVTVTEIAPTEVTLNQEFAKLEIGSQLTLTATILPDDATDKTVTWATTNSSVATVTDAGVVTAVGQGECFITATCRDNHTMCHVIVVDHFIYITLDEHDVRLLPNHMFTLTPTVSPANTSLTVTSSEPSVAAARMANGTVQVVGVKEGTTVVKVNSSDGYAEADSCIVTVYTMRGDVNYDGFVNISDVTDLINYLLNGNSPAASFNVNADTNNDGNVNISDVTTLINHLLSGQELDPKEPEQSPQTKTFTVNGVTFTMVNVDGGTFSMGCSTEVDTNALSDEMPIHQVTLSSYYIGQTEVTQELWQAVMGSNPSNFKNDPQHLQLPVENVRWNECQDFLARLNELTGESFRLPTEAEWEFAARGGNQSHNYTYAGSNDIYEVAWFTENSDNTTHVVGTKKPNELGLFDMTGNVCEWCSDRYGFYPETPQTNPTGPETGASRIYRGGGWQKLKVNCRITRRQYFAPTTTRYFMGLRLVL